MAKNTDRASEPVSRPTGKKAESTPREATSDPLEPANELMRKMAESDRRRKLHRQWRPR